MLKKVFSTSYRAIGRVNRTLFINKLNRKLLKNHDFSIISNNCIGALISHDLNQKFLSPTVNLFLTTKDFIEFVENLDYYLQLEIEEITKDNVNYPVGKLGELEVHFVHYHSIEEAKAKWDERRKRINYKNLFIMMTDNDGCSEEVMQRFDNLPFQNKVLFTKKEYLQFKSTFYIKGYENDFSVGDLTAYKNILGNKLYDNFNYVKWLNNGL
jgi:uncharacterized protein (DUF1919 family)